jgi:hypothetical protein
MTTKLIVFLNILTVICSAQITETKFMFKIYTGFQSIVVNDVYVNSVANYTVYKRNVAQNLLPFSPAFAWLNSEGNIHEFEVTDLELKRDLFENSQQVNGGSVYITAGKNFYTNLIGLKYKFTYQLFKLKSWKLKPTIGYGPLVQFVYNTEIPVTHASSRYNEIDVMTYFHVEPGFELKLYKKMYSNFSIPVALASVNVKHRSIIYDNGNTTAVLASALLYNFFPKFYQFKLSLGYKF